MISEEESLSWGYYFWVRQIGITILFLALVAIPGVQAQIHGVPASVTSFGPGRGPTPGVPASVTSLGPNGFAGGNQFVVVPNCCNPLFVTNRGQFRRHHHNHFLSYYPVPVYTPYYADVAPAAVDDSMQEEDNGGPTLFDRRGSGPNGGSVSRPYAREQESLGASPADELNDRSASRASSSQGASGSTSNDESSSSDQSATVLVFKDGHKLEVTNYAIVSDVLYDLTPGHPRRIALSDLDLAATQKVNEDQGISFQLPGHLSGS